jgi:uncharacterized zinc-type alcohol dehydrogenase-like protein
MSTSTDTLTVSTAPVTVKAWAAQSATDPLAPFAIRRRDPQPGDVVIDIQYCGVCHSDLHQVRNEWHNSVYPVVPGHEIVGRVTKVGRDVKKFREGDMGSRGLHGGFMPQLRQLPPRAGAVWREVSGSHLQR